MSTYVISDIHGCYDVYIKLLKKINFNQSDTLYILGDVVDRGPDSFKVLYHIMEHDNITLLLGNHELMMQKALIFPNNERFTYLWYQNGGMITHEQFNELEQWEQRDILEYLESLPISIQIKYPNITYLLVHSFYTERNFIKDVVMQHDLPSSEIEKIVWFRDQKVMERNLSSQDFVLVSGHTPTMRGKNSGKIYRGAAGHYINIDCGCCYNLKTSSLACLQLDNMKEYYQTNQPSVIKTFLQKFKFQSRRKELWQNQT